MSCSKLPWRMAQLCDSVLSLDVLLVSFTLKKLPWPYCDPNVDKTSLRVVLCLINIMWLFHNSCQGFVIRKEGHAENPNTATSFFPLRLSRQPEQQQPTSYRPVITVETHTASSWPRHSSQIKSYAVYNSRFANTQWFQKQRRRYKQDKFPASAHHVNVKAETKIMESHLAR